MNFSKRNLTTPEAQYFSISDIIATNERVPCRFEAAVPKLGFLEASSDKTNLPAGTKLELPLWMAESFQGRHVINIDVPKVYKETYREIINADANIVDLHKMGPFYYHLGLYILRLRHNDTEEISRTLNQTFRNRFRRLMDYSQNTLDEDVTLLTAKLDETERVLFNLGQKSLHELKAWEECSAEKIEMAHLVVNHRKRKRVLLDDSL